MIIADPGIAPCRSTNGLFNESVSQSLTQSDIHNCLLVKDYSHDKTTCARFYLYH